MGMPETPGDRYFTYDDYLKWPEEERWEIIEGQAYAMTPSPTWKHQEVQGAIYEQFRAFFRDKPCRVFLSPLDVRLPNPDAEGKAVDTVVQPDLLVLCDSSKLDDRSVVGAPDLVIEILSESTAWRDQDVKLRLYEKHGVRCYIVVDPWGKTLTIRILEAEGRYGLPEIFAGQAQMPVRIFEGLIVDVGRVFEGI